MLSRVILAGGLAALCLVPALRPRHAPPIVKVRAPEIRQPLPGAFAGPELRGGALSIHMAPFENLEKIDVATLDEARHEIDLAAYVLTDYAIVEALARAADRGVAIRILLDRGQATFRPEVPPLTALRGKPHVEIRIKRGRVYMHLKAYQVDGRLLRLGSANFSASGEKQQDNELTLLESRPAASRFHAIFDAMFAAGAKE